MPGEAEDQLITIVAHRCTAMTVTTIGRQQSLGLHVIAQHQLLGIGIQIDPLPDPIAVVANPSCKTRLKRQNQRTDELTVTTRIQIGKPCDCPLLTG